MSDEIIRYICNTVQWCLLVIVIGVLIWYGMKRTFDGPS